jgi:hypothetical protein
VIVLGCSGEEQLTYHTAIATKTPALPRREWSEFVTTRPRSFPSHLGFVRPTLRISCEAVPPSVSPAGAQGGTSARRTGAALSFVSCIRLFDGP